MTISATPLLNAYQGGTFAFYTLWIILNNHWIVLKSFKCWKVDGWLSKIFCNLKDNKLKKKIAREFNLPQHEYLESWCKCAVALRNCLAHHSRVWNRKYPLKPQLPGKLKGNWIDTSITPPTKLYAQLCCLAYLQNATHPGNDFKQQVKSLLKVHPNVDVAAMGFPANWGNEPLWK